MFRLKSDGSISSLEYHDIANSAIGSREHAKAVELGD
jgi:hypothetical protein